MTYAFGLSAHVDAGLAIEEMGAPVFSTNFVGQGTQAHKRVMTCPASMYSRCKSIEGQAKQAYEIAGGLYSAYKIG